MTPAPLPRELSLTTVAKLVAVVVGAVIWWMTLTGEVRGLAENFTTQHRELLQQHESQLPVLRQICRNTATTELALQNCDQAR